MQSQLFVWIILESHDCCHTFNKHPEEGCKVEVSVKDNKDTPWELNSPAGEVDALHVGSDDPKGVGQDEGQKQVGVDLVPQASQFSEFILDYATFNTTKNNDILEVDEDGDGQEESYQAEGVPGEVDVWESMRVSHLQQRLLILGQSKLEQWLLFFCSFHHNLL